MVNATLRSLYPRERPGTHYIGGWRAPVPVWRKAENLAPTGIRSPTVQPIASRYTDYVFWLPIKAVLRTKKIKKEFGLLRHEAAPMARRSSVFIRTDSLIQRHVILQKNGSFIHISMKTSELTVVQIEAIANLCPG